MSNREFDDDVLGLYARGLRVDEVAALMGCTHQTVHNVLRRNAVVPRARTRPYRWESVDWEAVIADYLERALTVAELLQKHGITHHDLYRYIALKPEVTRRRDRACGERVARKVVWKRRVLPDPSLDVVVKLYEAGVRIREILATCGIHNDVLYRELTLRRIPRRKGSGYRRNPSWPT